MDARVDDNTRASQIDAGSIPDRPHDYRRFRVGATRAQLCGNADSEGVGQIPPTGSRPPKSASSQAPLWASIARQRPNDPPSKFGLPTESLPDRPLDGARRPQRVGMGSTSGRARDSPDLMPVGSGCGRYCVHAGVAPTCMARFLRGRSGDGLGFFPKGDVLALGRSEVEFGRLGSIWGQYVVDLGGPGVDLRVGLGSANLGSIQR